MKESLNLKRKNIHENYEKLKKKKKKIQRRIIKKSK